MPVFPVTKKCEFIVPITKNPTIFTAILRPFGPGCQNFCMRFEFGLHMPVKFYLDPLRFAIVNLLQNCYFCLIQKTVSNSLLWSLVIKYFWWCCFAPPCLLHPGATAPPPPQLRHWNYVTLYALIAHLGSLLDFLKPAIQKPVQLPLCSFIVFQPLILTDCLLLFGFYKIIGCWFWNFGHKLN